MVLYCTPDQPQFCSIPDQLQVPICWGKGRFYEGFHFPFVKLLGICHWLHAYLTGRGFGVGASIITLMWESTELRTVI